MINSKFTFQWKKIQDAIQDAAKFSSREISRGVEEAKKQFGKVQLIQKRKELFAELGRNLYEAHQDGLSEEVTKFLKETELQEIIQEIKETDNEILKLREMDK